MDYTSLAILPIGFLQKYYTHIFKEILILKSGRIEMLKKKVSWVDLCSYMHSLFTVMASGKSFGEYKVGESDLCSTFYALLFLFQG